MRLTIYTRRGCHLCDEMKAIVHEVGRTRPLRLAEIDVDQDPALQRRYGQAVPVLATGGRELARHRVTADELLEMLKALTTGHQAD